VVPNSVRIGGGCHQKVFNEMPAGRQEHGDGERCYQYLSRGFEFLDKSKGIVKNDGNNIGIQTVGRISPQKNPLKYDRYDSTYQPSGIHDMFVDS
jgi:hypothetical protein